MKYSKIKTLTLSNSLNKSECLVNFNDLIINEGYTGVLVFNETDIVLDMDCVELKIAQSEHRVNNSSMDCAFVIDDESNEEVLLVELRFNYKNMKNLDRNKLLKKVLGSTLAIDNSIPINNKYIFIFKKSLVQQAKNRLYRMMPKIPNNYLSMSIQELKTEYF